MGNRIENNKLIQNSHTKIQTTWDIINKKSGINKKRCQIQALNVEDITITNEQTNAENFSDFFCYLRTC
jgi:hypothetical protein